MKSMNERRLILALAIARIPCLRPEERLLLWDLVDDEIALSSLLLEELEEIVGRELGRAWGARTGGMRPWSPISCLETAARDARFLERSGGRFVHYDDPEYPRALRETTRPPFGLFVRGSLPDPAVDAVAIVGTRMPTGRAIDSAFSLARDLAEEGVPVVSGLARGIDAAAHRGALAASFPDIGGGVTAATYADRVPGTTYADRVPGTTYAVLPCGIDRVYPTGHRSLAAAILESGGGLVSEYPPDTDIRTYRFPERNRIIAGFCRACVVVEAPARSGALITAEHALDEGRDVWVVADCLGGPRSAGVDRLEEDGALALRGADDLLEDWGRAPKAASEVREARSAEPRHGRTKGQIPGTLRSIRMKAADGGGLRHGR
jgi:DNA processing protein